MGELTTTIHQRLSDAYQSLHTAHATGDDYLAETQEAEIEDLNRIAADHGIELRQRCA